MSSVVVQLLAGERQKGESRKAVLACNDWLRMGPGRSLANLWRKFTESNEESQPTRSYGTLRQWSARYDWESRAKEYDAELERQKNELRRQVMESGFALDFERVDELKDLSRFLIDQLYERDESDNLFNLWLPDVKQIGSGESAERVDIVRFNAALIHELRGVLDDLAKETGGRVGKQEITGKDGGPLETRDVTYSDDQRANLITALIDRARTRDT